MLVPNSTKSQVFKIPLYLLNGRHYLVKLKAWRELWEAAGGLKDPPLSDATISIENSHKKKKEKKNRQNSLQCSYSQKKKKKIPIIRYPFKKFHLDISRDLFSLYLNYICSENYHQNIPAQLYFPSTVKVTLEAKNSKQIPFSIPPNPCQRRASRGLISKRLRSQDSARKADRARLGESLDHETPN